MDLDTMRTAVRTRIGVPAGDTFFVDGTLTDLVNEALQAISTEMDWPWLQVATTFATVAGTQAYTPPAGWQRTKGLIINGHDPIEWRSLPEIRSYDTADQGVPRIFTVFDEDLLLAPIPSGVHTILHDYIKTEPTLALDADTPLMPAIYHYSIVAFAAHLAHVRAGDLNRAGAALAEYQGWLGRLRDNRRRSSAPMRVRVRPGRQF